MQDFDFKEVQKNQRLIDPCTFSVTILKTYIFSSKFFWLCGIDTRVLAHTVPNTTTGEDDPCWFSKIQKGDKYNILGGSL